MDPRALLSRTKRAFESAMRVNVYSRSVHGHSDCIDVLRSGVPIRTVFDVGANVGGVAHEYLRHFPDAIVHCFEPAPATFEQLKANIGHSSRVRLHREAMGTQVGKATMFVGGNSLTNSLVQSEGHSAQVEVPVSTLDAFCQQHSIRDIDLLKIDAEGFDIEVLRGARKMLAGGHVAFILIEVTPNRGVRQHVWLGDVQDFLEPLGFRLYGLYDQMLAWDGRPMVQFANALFRRQ
jgi:FkbM family methyltransferase